MKKLIIFLPLLLLASIELHLGSTHYKNTLSNGYEVNNANVGIGIEKNNIGVGIYYNSFRNVSFYIKHNIPIYKKLGIE